jgi:hypothetical protein
MEGTPSMKEPVPGSGQSGAGHLYIHLEGKAKAKFAVKLLNRFEEFSPEEAQRYRSNAGKSY